MESILERYMVALELLDAYDHQTLVCPEGTYYDDFETVEEAAVSMLYDMVKNPDSQDCEKSMAAIKFLQFLDWNNVLDFDNKGRISNAALTAIILMIERLDCKPFTILFVDGNHENFDRLRLISIYRIIL